MCVNVQEVYSVQRAAASAAVVCASTSLLSLRLFRLLLLEAAVRHYIPVTRGVFHTVVLPVNLLFG